MRHMIKLLSAVAGSALALAGAATVALAGDTSASGARVDVASSPLGRILVDSKGITLYDFPPDKGTTSVCYGACAALWPPLLTHGKPVAGHGAHASRLATTKRKDGKLQVTYSGHPLYYFVTDRKPGQTTGQGINQFGGPWWVISRPARRSIAVVNASGHTFRTPFAGNSFHLRSSHRRVAAEAGRYLGAVSVLVVGAIHLQQYYDAYFRVVPTIGTLFVLSFIGAGIVGATLLAPARLFGRRIGGVVHLLAALGAIGIALGTFASLLYSEYAPLFGFMESGYRLAIVLTLLFDVLTTVFLGVFLLNVAPQLTNTLANERRTR